MKMNSTLPFSAIWLGLIARCALFLIIAGYPDVVRAQEAKHFIDHPIDECRSLYRRGEHAVLAFSIAQASGCAYGKANLAVTRKLALSLCTRNVPANLRARAPCKIIFEDGQIVASKFVNSLRRPQRAPVTLEIFDGATGKLQKVSGYISQGKFASYRKVPTKLMLSSGLVICEGTTDVAAMNFTASCFGKGPYKGKILGKLRPSGTVFFEGLYRPEDSFSIRDGKSYIKGKVSTTP